MKQITIDNQVYIRLKDFEISKSTEFVIVRTYSAGVFFGRIESRSGREVVMRNARRIWYWEGANSLSDLAVNGTKLPEKCKFPVEVDRIELFEVIEILNVTEKAKKIIDSVPVWSFE